MAVILHAEAKQSFAPLAMQKLQVKKKLIKKSVYKIVAKTF